MTAAIDLGGFRLEAWQLAAWAVLVVAATAMVRRLLGRWEASTGVRMAAFSAVMSTLVSGNSSWRYFGAHLQVTDPHVRALMFATGECMQFALALMARENYMAEGSTGGGVASLLVWAVSGVQCVPAFEEGGLAGGFVRSALGPVSAAVLWHLAMGVELVHLGPADHRGGRLGRIARFLAESVMASLGLAQPDRDAEAIAKDRAVRRAVRHGLRYDLMSPKTRGRRRGRRAIRRMKWAMQRAEIGTDRVRTLRLARQLAGARSASALIEMDLPSLWESVRADLLTDGWVASARAAELAEVRSEEAGGAAAEQPEPVEAGEPGRRAADTSVSALLEGLGFAGEDRWIRDVVTEGSLLAVGGGGYAGSAYPPPYPVPAGYAETFVSAGQGRAVERAADPVPAGFTSYAADGGQDPTPLYPADANASSAPGQGTAVPAQAAGFDASRVDCIPLGDSDVAGSDTRGEASRASASAVSAVPVSTGVAGSPELSGDETGDCAQTSADTADTDVSAVSEGTETFVSAPWTETRWSRTSESIAREVVADFHARRRNITCRAWVAEVRERGGQISSEHVSALYRLAREPEVPDPADTAE
ncbi:hypothetical protein KDK95_27990 [Actinospica sp. MGRD01-02]|uniref:Uncharacterized protein n=1 Tax=Actinospica acidithermotolerans TaxID=2828514 RepID=A0A941EF04_9ACTN|nr:hypothetical protein [Actinospica acidithermotolerans]MBR7830177.1 hypothetical protein [Actinospica acidithermotolerans]